MKKYAQSAVILVTMPFLGGCFAAHPDQAASSRERVMQEYLSGIVRSDGIDAREAVVLARSELIFRSMEGKYNLKEPLVEDYDPQNYSVQFFSNNKTLGQMLTGAVVTILVDKESGSVYLEEEYKNPGRVNEVS